MQAAADDAPPTDFMAPAARRHLRSFVRREGRLTSAQKAALDLLHTGYGIVQPSQPLSAAALFGPGSGFDAAAETAWVDRPLSIEIGFGNGAALATRAAERPDWNFLGIEVHRPGVGHLLRQAQTQGLSNLRVACADAVEVLCDWFLPGCADEILVLFPDPWPKLRHHKRRLIQPSFARQLALALRPGGRLRLATDWQDYAGQMLAVLNNEPLLANSAIDGGYAARPDDRQTTRFEARGLRLGHAVFDLDYRRV